jgi:transcriptional regulator with XRE-family HTH domain
MEQTRKTSGEFIRKARMDRGMTQSELASAVHIGTSMMSMIESGSTGFSVDTSDALATVLDIDPNELRRIAGLPEIDQTTLLRAAQYAQLDIDTRRPLMLQAIRRLLRLSDESLRIIIQQMGAFPNDYASGSTDSGDMPAGKNVRKRKR